MALTKEAEEACFDAFNAAFVADTAHANGLANVTLSGAAYTSNAVLLGNIVGGTTALSRVGDPERTSTVPRIEWEGAASSERETMGHARVEMIVRLHHYTNRETPDGFGSQNAVAIRSRQVFHRAALTTTGGWTFAVLHRLRGFQAPSADTEQHYIVEYSVIMTAATGDY